MALGLYCRDIKISHPNLLKTQGPLLLACNHPNSFLDAIILDTVFQQPIISLARGDAFSNKRVAAVLKSLNILPVYRISEGAENLGHNYKTFDVCQEVFRKNGIVLIFSEGLCINEWHLRPLKKGTARLAISCWKAGIPLKVLPVGINYDSFKSFRKQVHLNFGEMIESDDLFLNENHGTGINRFNTQLEQQLKQLVYEIRPDDTAKRKQLFDLPVPAHIHMLLFLPAFLGMIIHGPMFLPVRSFVKNKFGSSDHHDSILVGLLFFMYPIYLLMLYVFLSFFIPSHFSWLIWLVAPFCAWGYFKNKNGVGKE